VGRSLSHPRRDLIRCHSLLRQQYTPQKGWTHYTRTKQAPKEEECTRFSSLGDTKVTERDSNRAVVPFPFGKLSDYYWYHSDLFPSIYWIWCMCCNTLWGPWESVLYPG
jgi:hypothetical protein